MTSVGRRSFLRAAGAAALAAPGTARAPKIRVGLFGTDHGHVRSKLRALRSLNDFELVAVHDPNPENQKSKRNDELFEGLDWVTERELLEARSLDMVLVEGRIRNAIHWGRNVIEAGKHLHIEKPPSPDLEPFRDLLDEARRKKLLVQQGYNYRYHPGIRAAIEAKEEGWLGDVYMMRATMNSDRGPEQRELEARYPGGAFFELAGHMVDRAVELFGRPEKVQHWLRHDTSADDDLADNTMAVLEYPKALAVISTAARMPNASQHRSFELIGSDGSFHIQPISGPRTMQVNMRRAQGPYRAGWQELELGAHPFDVEELKAFAHSVRTGEPLRHSYDHELLVHETLLRASGHIA